MDNNANWYTSPMGGAGTESGTAMEGPNNGYPSTNPSFFQMLRALIGAPIGGGRSTTPKNGTPWYMQNTEIGTERGGFDSNA